MRFSCLLALAAASGLVVANPVNQADSYELGGQQEQLPIGDVASKKRTRTVTQTHTFLEVVETVYMTKPQLVPTWVPAPPKPQIHCDEHLEVSCAICRTIHKCIGFEEEW